MNSHSLPLAKKNKKKLQNLPLKSGDWSEVYFDERDFFKKTLSVLNLNMLRLFYVFKPQVHVCISIMSLILYYVVCVICFCLNTNFP